MVNFYLDTSALLKQYVDESGSVWLRAQISAATLLASTQLLIVETVSAFNRRMREGTLTLPEYHRIRDIFRQDCQTTYQIVPLTTAIVDLACEVSASYPLRSYDAIHLATALTVQYSLQRRNLAPLTFLSADNSLNEAASAEGLLVDNPKDHPKKK